MFSWVVSHDTPGTTKEGCGRVQLGEKISTKSWPNLQRVPGLKA